MTINRRHLERRRDVNRRYRRKKEFSGLFLFPVVVFPAQVKAHFSQLGRIVLSQKPVSFQSNLARGAIGVVVVVVVFVVVVVIAAVVDVGAGSGADVFDVAIFFMLTVVAFNYIAAYTVYFQN